MAMKLHLCQIVQKEIELSKGRLQTVVQHSAMEQQHNKPCEVTFQLNIGIVHRKGSSLNRGMVVDPLQHVTNDGSEINTKNIL